MPYKTYKEGNQYCTYKLNADDSKGPKRGCSDSRATAMRHQRALYAAENKGIEIDDVIELKELETMLGENWEKDMGEEMGRMTPWGARSFADLDAAEEAEQVVENVRELTENFRMLVGNILYDPASNIPADLKALADEYAMRVEALKTMPADMEDKELEEKAVWSTAYVNNLPDSAFLFISSGGKKDKEGKTTPRSLRHLPYKDAAGNIDLPHLRNALARAPQMQNVSKAQVATITKKAEAILKRANKEAPSLLERVAVKVGLAEKALPVDAGMMVWKEADTPEPVYRWVARYSNNLRDRDYPPEIISAASHQAFVQAVDNKEAPLPELWLWHVPEWKVGQADFVAWDETPSGVGFALAGGTFDKEANWVAETLANFAEIGVSHGMPRATIVRDPADPTVILRHITKEISPLPTWAAANPWADFNALPEYTKENPMSIPTEKRQKLVDWGFSEENLAALEARNAQASEKALDEAVEHKEADPTPETPAPVPAETPASVAPEATLSTELVAQLSAAMKQVLDPLAATMQTVLGRLDTVEASVKEMQHTEEEKLGEQVKGIPASALGALLVKSIIGTPEAQVDGRTMLGKSKPTLPAEMEEKANPGAGSNLFAGVIGDILAEHTHAN